MIEPHLRRSMRIPVAYKGAISDGQRTLKCLIQDVSDSGMLIVASEPFRIGQILDLKCDIEPGRYLECKIEVRFCDDTCMGVRIVEISAQSAGGYQHCVDEDVSPLPEKS
jgi:hypothetical protein